VTLSIGEHDKSVPACPQCNGKDIRPLVSMFFSQTSRSPSHARSWSPMRASSPLSALVVPSTRPQPPAPRAWVTAVLQIPPLRPSHLF
jgi:hypothetical protein